MRHNRSTASSVHPYIRNTTITNTSVLGQSPQREKNLSPEPGSNSSLPTLSDTHPLMDDSVNRRERRGHGRTSTTKQSSCWPLQRKTPQPRTIYIGNERLTQPRKYPVNRIRNQKYHPATFLFVVLFNQFKYFFNLYFLLVCISQFIPLFRVTYLITNVVPLTLVLTITLCKEAWDDVQRWRRDREANSQRYERIQRDSGSEFVPCSELRVGDIVVVEKDQRVPADLVLLRTAEHTGSVFIRTDQLDGETDWKLRTAVPPTQHLLSDADLFAIEAAMYADRPHKDIHHYIGTLSYRDPASGIEHTEPLNVENTLWMNTVVASGPAVGCVMYTGEETRATMNTSRPATKEGLTDAELNTMSKLLCAILVMLAITMVALKGGFSGLWWVYLVRFVVLFSTIIPLSLRVNLDMAKTVCSSAIARDERIPGTIVRTSTIPEELGRISFLLSDKTGTLTKNDMELKKIHLGTVAFGHDAKEELRGHIRAVMLKARNSAVQAAQSMPAEEQLEPRMAPLRGRRDIAARVFDVSLALSLCHNVTPVTDAYGRQYQASSPDEIAIVKWCESVGVELSSRDRESVTIRVFIDAVESIPFHYDILHLFPFTSDTKRMGIVIQDRSTGELTFLEKGADLVMAPIVQANDWLSEECDNFAREGLRTLVIAKKRLSVDAYESFNRAYNQARLSIQDRQVKMQGVISEHLEKEMELLGVTGVEDKLQDDVRLTLETLRNAGVKVWMLTGDKVETATCIATSSRLITRSQPVVQVQRTSEYDAAESILSQLEGRQDSALVIDGVSLQFLLDHYKDRFAAAVTPLQAVVCCRCTPTQKADIARLVSRCTGKRVACIGDGGNDVSMIQAAQVGIGIVGKEGRQASLAADFSITQFSHLSRLLLWHGRNSYRRTAKVSQFVIHRGFVIATMQAVFSAIFYFSPIALYQGLIAIGYTTVYTMFPVFSLVLDLDITEDMALLYPELYRELGKGRELSFKTFFKWLMISTYQGAVIMMLAMCLFEQQFIHIVSITFTALVLNEWAMIALEITHWHWLMALAVVSSVLIYITSIRLLREDFDPVFATSWPFLWKVAVITFASFVPLLLFKTIKRIYSPPSYAKLR